jgi:uncharacterized protein DUF6455
MHDNDKRWPMYRRVLHQAQRMEDMMRHLGVDPAPAARQHDGQGFARARIVCLVCPYAEACGSWLTLAGDAAEPPDFCPNAEFFAAARKTPIPHTD